MSNQTAILQSDKNNEWIEIKSDTGNKIIIETESYSSPRSSFEKNQHESELKRSKISSLIKIIIPKSIMESAESELDDNVLNSSDFTYISYVPERYPAKGWINGTIYNIAMTAKVTLTPSKQIEEYILPLQGCMNVIENVVENIDKQAKKKIAELLNQPEDVQTWRMAGMILSNAMVFYSLISNKIRLKNEKKCKSLNELRGNYDVISKKNLESAWQDILDYNYNPIFSIAKKILSTFDDDTSKKIIKALHDSSDKIHSRNVAGASDMYGKLLQKVIVDRDKLASYYTRPEAAALVTKLVVPEVHDPIYGDSITKYRIADFACGTGLLLSSVYRQLLFNYEASRTTSKKMPVNQLHKALIEECFIGLDVLPIAAHLAVSSLAMMFPKEIFGKTKVKTMPIGHQHTKVVYLKKRGAKKEIKKKIKHYRLGSLDLIKEVNATLTQSVEVVKGKEIEDTTNRPWSIEESHHLIGDNSCDLIVMNPPFVRPTNHAGVHDNAVPTFAAFGSSDEDQKEMGKLLTRKFTATCGSGNAGLATHFLAVCNKKINRNGTMSLILPATISSGESWAAVRDLLKNEYHVTVISIARPKISTKERSFSSDTGMGEIILRAKKMQSSENPRGLFISIYERPQSILDAIQIGDMVNNTTGVDRLETGNGGTTLRIGRVPVGSMLDCPLGYNWPFVNVVDPFVEQIAYKITHGHNLKHAFTTIAACFEIGLGGRDITGGNMRGPFEFNDQGKYPSLWNNVQEQQTKMLVSPDKQLKPKKDATKKHIDNVWFTASYIHININPDYTANSLIASHTTIKVIGGSTWPSVIMEEKYEKPFVVWCNSTYGILCYWSLTGKQQLGRGRTSRTAIQNLPIPDFTKMSKDDLVALSCIYDKYHNIELDRIKNLWKDKTRISLDGEISKIFGFNMDMNDIRIRLCMEPSISGGKPESTLIKKHGDDKA